jgi:hypothetical protein
VFSRPGSRLGGLRDVGVGVFQITAPNVNVTFALG